MVIYAIDEETIVWEGPLLASAFQKKGIILGGHSFVLHGRSDDAFFASLVNNHDPEFLAMCRRLVAEDAVCLDIGANIGTKTLFLARHASRGRVIAVEAGPKNAECLSVNVEANNLKNVDVVNAAIGDRTAEVKFAENFAWGFVSDEGVAVPMMTIADLAKQFALDRIDFIKIDVEGYEFPILKSALDLINQYGTLVAFEFNSWCQIAYSDTNPKEFLSWILQNFEHVFLIERDALDGDHPLQRIEKDQALNALHDNIIRYRCVTDMLVTNRADRLNPSPGWLSTQLERAGAERDQLRVERDAAKSEQLASAAERDQLRAERDAAKAEQSTTAAERDQLRAAAIAAQRDRDARAAELALIQAEASQAKKAAAKASRRLKRLKAIVAIVVGIAAMCAVVIAVARFVRP